MALRTPLILTAQSSSRASILDRECVLYSTLLVREEVTQVEALQLDRQQTSRRQRGGANPISKRLTHTAFQHGLVGFQRVIDVSRQLVVIGACWTMNW
jgi:hypothetical protein